MSELNKDVSNALGGKPAARSVIKIELGNDLMSTSFDVHEFDTAKALVALRKAAYQLSGDESYLKAGDLDV